MFRIVVLIAGLLVAGSTASLARNGMPEDVPYAFKVRCETLAQQFEEAQVHPKSGDVGAARAAAAQGAALCRSGRYEEGGTMLARALRMIGEQAY